MGIIMSSNHRIISLSEAEKGRYPFGFLHFCSTSLLIDYLTSEDGVILDIGSGPSSYLARFVFAQRKNYIPLDRDRVALAELKGVLAQLRLPVQEIYLDLLKEKIPSRLADVAHARLLFARIAPQKRLEILANITQAVSRCVMLLDYDRSAMVTTDSVSEKLLSRYSASVQEYMEIFSIEPNMGQLLPDLARAEPAFRAVNVIRFKREEGRYADELILSCESMATALAPHAIFTDLRNRLLQLADELKAVEESFRYTPSDLVAVVAQKVV